MKKLDTETFVARSKEKYGDFFDYSRTKYVNRRTKVEIICPKHGSFFQKPDAHLRKSATQGCLKCYNEVRACKIKKDFSEVVEKFQEKYGDEYSVVEYINSKKVVVKHICGRVFTTTYSVFLKGNKHNCFCVGVTVKRSSPEEKINFFLKKSAEVHGSKYLYQNIRFEKTRTDLVDILCPKHGIFQQTPSSHMLGRGCQKCGNEKKGATRLKLEQTHSKIEQKNGHKFILIEERRLLTSLLDVKVLCKKCQKEMTFTCNNLIFNEVECKYCGLNSRGEREIKRFLESHKINFKCQKTFPDCVNPRSNLKLRFDFYLEDLAICIEYDGVHHFPKEQHFFGNKPAWYSEKDFENIKFIDRIRDEYCEKNSIRMIRIPYWKRDEISEILKTELLGGVKFL